jgi:cysteine-rich repeat protein
MSYQKILAVLGFAVAVLGASSAGAATYTVINLSDDGSPGTLRFLLNTPDLQNGDTIEIPTGRFELSPGDGSVFDGSQIDVDKTPDLDVTKSVSIQGAGLLKTIIVGKGKNDRIFDIHRNITVTIKGMTVQNGNISGNGGGIRVMGADGVTIQDAAVVGNTATVGGGIYHSGTGSVTLQNAILAANPGNNCAGSFVDGGGNTDTDGTCLSGTAIECGNGVIEPGEACDDANTADNDGCSSLCESESGGGGGAPSGNQKFPFAASAAVNITLSPVCGNGKVEGTEQCDDGGEKRTIRRQLQSGLHQGAAEIRLQGRAAMVTVAELPTLVRIRRDAF